MIEILVALSIAAILATLAVPSFRSLIDRTQVDSSANQFVAALDAARSYAVRNDASTKLCPSADGGSCASGQGLQAGWIVLDESGGAPVVVHAWPSPPTTVAANFGPKFDSLHYGPDGLPTLNSGALPIGHVNFCAGHQVRQVFVDATGRVRSETPTGSCDACGC